jgi:hypothetical protein
MMFHKMTLDSAQLRQRHLNAQPEKAPSSMEAQFPILHQLVSPAPSPDYSLDLCMLTLVTTV